MIKSRIIVNNSMTARITRQLDCFAQGTYSLLDELDVIQNINNYSDTAILAYGYPFYQQFRDNVEHIGMRNFSYDDFCNVPIVTFGNNNKLIFGRYPKMDPDENESVLLPSKYNPEEWMMIEPKLNFFMGPNIDREFEAWPETKCIGLNEAVDELINNWIPYIGQEGVGIDFESSSFPDCSDFILSGVALASAKRKTSVFIDFRMDNGYNTMYDVRDHAEFMKAFYEYVTKNKAALWAFNCSFEIGALYWMFNEKIYIQDAMALCLCDDQRKSLKYNWQYYGLGNSWDDFQDIQRNACILANKTYMTFEDFNRARNTMVDVYDENGNVIDKISEAANVGIDLQSLPPDNMLKNYWGHEWLQVDPAILGPYCCYDAYAGLKLAQLLYPAYKYPYDVFLSNKYFQFELSQRKFDVDISKRDKGMEYLTTIENNYKVWVDYFKASRVVETEAREHKWDWITELGINSPVMEWIITNCPDCITPDPIYFAKGLTDYLLFLPENKESFDSIDLNGTFNTHLLDGLFGHDYSSKLSWINTDYLMEEGWEATLDENGNQVLDGNGNPAYHSIGFVECICKPADQYVPYKHDGYKAYSRKRGMFKKLGLQLFTDLVNIPEWVASFNNRNLPMISAVYNNWYEQNIKRRWILSIPPIGSYYNILDLRKIKNDGTEKYPEYQDWMATPIEEDGFGISESDFKIIKTMPQEEVDKLAYAIDLSDPSVLASEISYSLPEEVNKQLEGKINTYTDYLTYRKMVSIYNKAKSFPPHKMYEHCEGNFEETYEPMVNIFSYVTQAPEWHNSFKTDMEVVKALACIRFYWEYRCLQFRYVVPEYGHGRHQDESGKWVTNDPPTIDYGERGEEIPCVPGSAFYWDWPEFVEQFNALWNSGEVHKHKIFKEMMDANWKTEIWTTDCVGGNLVYNAIIPNVYTDIMSFDMPEDMCQRICKFSCLYDVVSTARKMNKSYFEHMYVVTGRGTPYKNKWEKISGIKPKDGHLSFSYDFISGDEYICEEFEPIDEIAG